MNTFVVSDLHIGSRFFLAEAFVDFARRLPPDAALVLAGDVLDRWHSRPLPPPHEAALETLRTLSRKQSVTWVRGNHDEDCAVENPQQIRFVPSHAIGQRVFISHGYDFDDVTPHNRSFLVLFRALHRLRLRLGAPPVHVARYAKQWVLLYGVLRRHVRHNAVAYARAHGYAAVICGHIHCIEDQTVDGIRYLNTGSWTEQPLVCAVVNERTLALQEITSVPNGPQACGARREGA